MNQCWSPGDARTFSVGRQVTAYGDLLLEKSVLADTDRYRCLVNGYNMDNDKQLETTARFYHYVFGTCSSGWSFDVGAYA